MTTRNYTFASSMLLLFATIPVLGCGSSNSSATQSKNNAVVAKDNHDQETEAKAHDHSGWWCAEHGVPEGVCSQCNAKVAADFQKKSDWCADHNRAKSQCFLCDPALKEKFAAQYRAKEGKEPPAIEEEDGKQDSTNDKS